MIRRRCVQTNYTMTTGQDIALFSQNDSQEYEEMEGIEDQHLIGQDEEDRLLGIGSSNQPNTSSSGTCIHPHCSNRNYTDFISYLINQLPPMKRKHAEKQFEELEKGKGE